MKFSVAAVAAFLAVGAVASYHPEPEAEEEYTTVVVTEYTTYCDQSTTLTAGTETIPVETVRHPCLSYQSDHDERKQIANDNCLQPGSVTLTNGPYTVTRPLLTTTVTRCKAWYVSSPVVGTGEPR
ncbi:hypothetical protein BJX61DRAFT_504449 [Aspergillus egyptiacus]|nr:hypothetical protein BJX61DRAFT_504449 [Aspergillus egyptiacus]